MAAFDHHVTFEDVATTPGSFKTICSIGAPANHNLRIKGFALAFSGIAGDAKPIAIRFQRHTATSGTGTTATKTALHGANSALTPLCFAEVDYSSEPTGKTGILYAQKLHPQGGADFQRHFDDFVVAAGQEVGLQVKVETGQTAVVVSGYIHVEE